MWHIQLSRNLSNELVKFAKKAPQVPSLENRTGMPAFPFWMEQENRLCMSAENEKDSGWSHKKRNSYCQQYNPDNQFQHYNQSSIHRWNKNGLINYELLELGRTITGDVHCQQLDRVNDLLCGKWLCNQKRCTSPHDSARIHSELLTQNR